MFTCRAPSGARGLKREHPPDRRHHPQSRPFGGAWIETGMVQAIQERGDGRAPSGARGLKHRLQRYQEDRNRRRAPSGARGLKPADGLDQIRNNMSRPFGGAWIETGQPWCRQVFQPGRAPSGARGLKHRQRYIVHADKGVAPLRGRVD